MPRDRDSGQWFAWRAGPDGPYRDWSYDEQGNPQPAIIPGYTPDPAITDWIILRDPSQPAGDDPVIVSTETEQ